MQTFQTNLFPRLASAGTGTTCRVAEYWTYWQNPSMFIKWDFSIIDLKHLVNIDLSIITCRRVVIYGSYNSSLVICYLRQPLLDNNEGFLFCCKSTIRQPSHAVSGLKDVPKQFWQKEEVFLTDNLFEIEGKTACSFVEPSTDLIPLHASDTKESHLS